MATFVLVHGAWSGAHTFRRVRPLLRGAGHEVFTPSLTGLGERTHLLTPEVGLTTHVHDVSNAILYEDLRDIVLLGYSYGGSVVTGALEFVWDRVSHLVYLDAFVPFNGQSVDDMLGVTRSSFGLDEPWLAGAAHVRRSSRGGVRLEATKWSADPLLRRAGPPGEPA
jgi:pimeloyl-ACP methyl ester carboxylesterase